MEYFGFASDERSISVSPVIDQCLWPLPLLQMKYLWPLHRLSSLDRTDKKGTSTTTKSPSDLTSRDVADGRRFGAQEIDELHGFSVEETEKHSARTTKGNRVRRNSERIERQRKYIVHCWK
uniref:Uncharacterized protein n=1 Tax=Eucalyptus grandis TaxID=71139 RepID=A0A059BKC6_EUCGR